MSDSSEPLGDGYASTDRSSGKWLQLVLFGIGGVLFLGGVVTAGLPGAPLGLSVTDDPGASTPMATETPRPSPTSAATATSTGESTTTAAPTATERAAAGPPGDVVFRVNVGGPRLRGTGGGPAWSADRAGAPSKHLNDRRSDTVVSDTPDNITVERDVPRNVPRALFTQYRFERGSNRGPSEPMVWRFDVATNRTYQVRLYVLEAFFTRGPPTRPGEERYSEGGPREFGIAIENRTVARNYEPIKAHGHDVGGLRTFNATTDDGVLTVRFLREQENPTVSGIEIVDVGPRNASGRQVKRSPDGQRRGGQTRTARRTPGSTRTESGRRTGGSRAGARGGGRGNQTTTPTPTPTPANDDEDDGFFG